MWYFVETEIGGLDEVYSQVVEADNEQLAYESARQLWVEEKGTIPFPSFEACRIQLKDEIVVNDTDTDIYEKDQSGRVGIYPYYSENSSIDVIEDHFSIYEYLRQLNKGKIVIQPEFQRNQVWKLTQKSRFIESVILNFPLPPIYLNQDLENKYIVIDGLQRTTALSEFFDDKFALCDLEALPHYNGKKFSDLSGVLQSKLENKKLTIFSLKPSTPMYVIYDLFKRINTGGTQLNRQEIRNCIYNGKSTRLLKELAQTKEFLLATDYGISPNRMKDREVVLRYLAFRWRDYENCYDGDMSKFLESFMCDVNAMQDSAIDEIKHDFIRVMQMAYVLFGRNAFRIPTLKTRGVVNTAVLESVCYYLSFCSDEKLMTCKDDINRNYYALISNNDYLNTVSHSTASKWSVNSRFSMATQFLKQ